MNIEEQLLAAPIGDTFSDAERALGKYEHVASGATIDKVDEGDHADDLDEATKYLRFAVEKAYRDAEISVERLGLPSCQEGTVRKMQLPKDLAGFGLRRWEPGFHIFPLAAARRLFNSLAVMTVGGALARPGVFATIQSNTPITIHQAEAGQSKGGAQRFVVSVLRQVFRNAVQTMKLGNNRKVYKPHIGVRSAMAAVECNSIDSAIEENAALDGIYVDMREYSRRHGWRRFYVVHYLIKPFSAKAGAEAKYNPGKADLSWKPMVMVGPGARTKRQGKGAGA